MTNKTLRPYQQEALDKLLIRMQEAKHPLLVNASVGAGKSLIISELLLHMESKGWRCLCLTMNSTLIQQNAETYRLQGGNPGIYCSSLNKKDTDQPVIFGSPHSISRAIPDIRFNLIVIDECHNINHNENDSMYMKILNHYGMMAQFNNYNYRIVGLTGTPYRGKGIPILGEYFKEEVCNISASWLISQGYLVNPGFGISNNDYNFNNIKVNNLGKFNSNELQKIVDNKERLTSKIMHNLQSIQCNGIFIFASTKKHCYECAASLPDGEWAVITGETPHGERHYILEKARKGNLRYLISVGCLNVGVDIPNFDVCAWLRPTESLVLYTQGIGRILRLHPGKTRATILDYAGNVDRHGDIDDPIINNALQPREKNEQDYCIPCYTCGASNTIHARRCIGTLDKQRCNHFFTFKECPGCGLQNDITSRVCRGCRSEIIDPNKKLSLQRITYTLDVTEASYWVTTSHRPIINVKYKTNDRDVFESFIIKDDRTRNIAYARFVKIHIFEPSKYYKELFNTNFVINMIQEAKIRTPYKIICSKDEFNRYKVIRKEFIGDKMI